MFGAQTGHGAVDTLVLTYAPSPLNLHVSPYTGKLPTCVGNKSL